MRTVVLRVVALAMLLLLALVGAIAVRTVRRLPDTVIYFVESGERTFALAPVGRRSRIDEPVDRARSAVEALAEGPTAGERARGLASAVPPEVRVLHADYRDGLLIVDLSVDAELGGGSAEMQGRLYQLLYTLSQPHDVEAVSLRVEGDPVTAFGGEGILVDNPWRRAPGGALPRW